ncbi:CoA-acylating methylmalonate-semialdehyde dehydrogenase [Parapedobacter koreensis]|uniref:methylmalonate-semialdehyde dehydrogenase (CoA acylating) n=1 Tax=Parapedobacter koreensis TaxID=332977 RepID=A0A1H7L125_9SPHI|nr:CoA-acylating methylmalonate-semialdehyde dehydrogenase [Parapedobacter koreensis]SEK92692.1 malonate-semialdehyde dehydrogenase (acetylating) / methylmalonate-semialdehyde dehydrogenase [Parapedobacter koreensis]
MTDKTSIRKLEAIIGGKAVISVSNEHFDIYNPSTGQVQALAPKCTQEEVVAAIEAAHRVFPSWADVPVMKRITVLYKFRDLIERHEDELVELLSRENGKTLGEARGDVLKAKEVVELACGTPSLMMGESVMNVSSGFDTVSYREPLGVFAGIAPFNFPAMIPLGWMVPLCIATGNTIVLKASNVTPMTSFRMVELLYEAGLPAGVVNVLTCDDHAAAPLLEHPHVKGVTFVGSTRTGQFIYQKASEHGKRVQALCQAKNHALVLEDADLEKTAHAIINAAYGCAGERCMALSAVVAQETIADDLVQLLVQYAQALKVGPGYHPDTQMGPLVTPAHHEKVTGWIAKGLEEGAQLVLDGRQFIVPGFEDGCYLGPCLFDHVTPEMTIGDEEIFGPVLSIKRVKDFEEGLGIMNNNPYANGSIIFTNNGHYSREFARRTHAGMVGINVGIPVPVSIFPFTGHKQSFFGDLHAIGKDGVRFYTESKIVTTHWFGPGEGKKMDAWGGAM